MGTCLWCRNCDLLCKGKVVLTNNLHEREREGEGGRDRRGRRGGRGGEGGGEGGREEEREGGREIANVVMTCEERTPSL